MNFSLRLAVIAVAICSAMAAAPLFNVVSQGGGWQPVTAADESNVPYWNGRSYDGQKMNIGNCLLQGACGTSPVDQPLYYYGNADGSAVDMSFAFSSPMLFTMRFEPSAYAGINEFGFAFQSSPQNRYAIFQGPDNPGTSRTVSFAPSGSDQEGNVVFYLKVGSDVYFSDTRLNAGGEQGFQHFVVFSFGNEMGVSYEDLERGSRARVVSDDDFQDGFATASAVPEPATNCLVGGTLIGLACLYRRRHPRR